MTDYDTEAARQALEAALGEGPSAPTGEQATPPAPESGTSEVEQPRATEPDTFSNIDPNTLAPELQAIYKQMQGDYTRKTQTLAERERVYNAFGGVEEVRNAVQFTQALRDPQNLVQLHEELSEYLQTQGLTPAEADAAATKEIQTATPREEEWGFSDPDDEIRKKLTELESQNQELLEWRNQQEEQRMLVELEQDIARKESFIRQNNPAYKDSDIDSIYIMSYAFGGDLLQAQAAYEDQRRRFATEYMGSKGSVPSSLGPISTGGAEVPETFGRDLNAAHDYAKRRALAEFDQLRG